MEILTLQQGSDEWHSVRAKHLCASEASIMMGVSRYMTREELIRQKATGTEKEGPEFIFAKGHKAEASARGIAENLLNDELFPATITETIDGMPLLASLDGLTMDGETIWEHKLYNADLVAEMRETGKVPEEHVYQVEQQLLVTGAKQALFHVSDGTTEKSETVIYKSSPERRKALLAGWKRFQDDVAAYKHIEEKPIPVANAIESLPALVVQVTGSVVSSNLPAFRAAAEKFISGINTDLKTDQDFADAEEMVKFCSDAEKKLEIVKEQALSQTSDIDELFRTIDAVKDGMKKKRLELDRNVKYRKDTIRAEIIEEGKAEIRVYTEEKNRSLPSSVSLPEIVCDIASAIKGKRTITSLRDAMKGTVANAKMAADEMADRIKKNLDTLKQYDDFLFPDIRQLVLKDNEVVILIAKERFDTHSRKVEESKKQAADNTIQKDTVVQQVLPVSSSTVNANDRQSESTEMLKLGDISSRLGFSLTCEQLKTIGIEPAHRVKQSVLYLESDFTHICTALISHIQNVMKTY